MLFRCRFAVGRDILDRIPVFQLMTRVARLIWGVGEFVVRASNGDAQVL